MNRWVDKWVGLGGMDGKINRWMNGEIYGDVILFGVDI